jgi:hypothetical protein
LSPALWVSELFTQPMTCCFVYVWSRHDPPMALQSIYLMFSKFLG